MKTIFNLIFGIIIGIVIVIEVTRYMLTGPLTGRGINLALLALWGFVFWGLVNYLPLPSIGGMP